MLKQSWGCFSDGRNQSLKLWDINKNIVIYKYIYRQLAYYAL